LDVVRQAGECGVIADDVDLVALLVHGDAVPDVRELQFVAVEFDGGLEGRWIGSAYAAVGPGAVGRWSGGQPPGRSGA
jgi:hypothetical protein